MRVHPSCREARACAFGVLLALIAPLGPGCSDDDAPGSGDDHGDAGPAVFDVDELVPPFEPGDAGAGGSAPGRTPFDAGGVALSGRVLTNQPQLAFADEGLNDLVVTSAFIRVRDGRLLVHGEFRNEGDVQRCVPLFERATIGTLPVVASANAPPYGPGGDQRVYACLDPGATGAFYGAQDNVPSSLLEEATEFRYAISGVAQELTPHLLAPVLLDAERVPDASGLYTVEGRLRSAAGPIFALEAVFYAKNEHGLVIDHTALAVADTISPRSILEFATPPFIETTREPAALRHFITFMPGERPSWFPAGAMYVIEPFDELQQRAARAAELRELAKRKAGTP